MTCRLRKDQISELRARKKSTGKGILEQMREAVLLNIRKSGRNCAEHKNTESLPLCKISIEERIPGVRDEDLRELLDGYFETSAPEAVFQRDRFRSEFEQLEKVIPQMFKTEIEKGEKALFESLGRRSI